MYMYVVNELKKIIDGSNLYRMILFFLTDVIEWVWI